MLPICNTFDKNSGIDHETHVDSEILREYIGADCWALVTVKNGISETRFSTFNLQKRIGPSLGTNVDKYLRNKLDRSETRKRDDIYTNIRKIMEESDEIHIYMYGWDTEKMVCTYDGPDRYKISTYKK